jgi:hypothetical protein
VSISVENTIQRGGVIDAAPYRGGVGWLARGFAPASGWDAVARCRARNLGTCAQLWNACNPGARAILAQFTAR